MEDMLTAKSCKRLRSRSLYLDEEVNAKAMKSTHFFKSNNANRKKALTLFQKLFG
jgi:hypothetical protein